MATPLLKRVRREVLVDGAAYVVAIDPEGVRVTRKGGRKPIEWSWNELVARREESVPRTTATHSRTDLPRNVSVTVAQTIDAALAALGRARIDVQKAAALPATLHRELAPDSHYGLAQQRDDWYVEPLLTVQEVAEVLRIPLRMVRKLPLKHVEVAGERRFRQSIVRQFIIANEHGAGVR